MRSKTASKRSLRGSPPKRPRTVPVLETKQPRAHFTEMQVAAIQLKALVGRTTILAWARGDKVTTLSALRITRACGKLGIRLSPPRPIVELAPRPGLAYTSPDDSEE